MLYIYICHPYQKSKMKIILVCIENFQDYIIDNIKNLKLFGNNDIDVLINRKFFSYLSPYNVNLYDIEELDDLGFYCNSNLDSQFRNGFWSHCSARLFYLYSYIYKYDIQNCIHLENDVMSYVNYDDLLSYFIPLKRSTQDLNSNFHRNKTPKIYATFDCDTRVIPGILYIPNHSALYPIIKNYDYSKNDMENLARFNENVIEPLPIIPSDDIWFDSNSCKKICKNYISSDVSKGSETPRIGAPMHPEFCDTGYIFDAAAIGQYLGGIDKRNQPGDTRGFINETCIVKYDKYKFYWKKINVGEQNGGGSLYVPYISLGNRHSSDVPDVRIINLHIHSKDLFKFMADNPLETKYIPFASDDY